jgi:hypothetical protein
MEQFHARMAVEGIIRSVIDNHKTMVKRHPARVHKVPYFLGSDQTVIRVHYTDIVPVILQELVEPSQVAHICESIDGVKFSRPDLWLTFYPIGL